MSQTITGEDWSPNWIYRSMRVAGVVLVFGLVPAMLTWALMAFAVPSPEAPGRFPHLVGTWGKEHPLPLALGLFLVLSGVLHYWRAALPGNRWLARPEAAAHPVSSNRGRQGLLFVSSIVAAATLALIFRMSLFGSYEVLSGSMMPTLEPGDRIGANKLAYGLHLGGRIVAGGTPRRGDLIVFHNPDSSGPQRLVKRVVGLPGDRVTMRGGHPVINGWEVPSCEAGLYVLYDPENPALARVSVEFLDGQIYLAAHTAYAQPFEGYDVKPGEVFVLGDNRAMSEDSRTWKAGIPIDSIDGRAQWLLLGSSRTGKPDFSRLFRPLRTKVHLEGMDTRPLQADIDSCIARRPASFFAPAPTITSRPEP